MPQPLLCALCLPARITWEAAHKADMEKASERWQAAAQEALSQGSPLRKAPEDFLHPTLRPGQPDGIPPLSPAVTVTQGMATCAGHLPGQPGAAPRMLIAQGPLSSAMLAGLRG